MAHYLTLADYHFTDDVDDIRGAALYGGDEAKFGKVKDVVFDHQAGEIRYVIVDAGKRKVAVPSGHVFRSLADQNDFAVDMSREQFEALPDFRDEDLRDERRWQEYERQHRESLKDWYQQQEAKYKERWHEAPVQHQHGSSRNITPDPGEMNERHADLPPMGSLGEPVEDIPAAEPSGEEGVSGDFTPHRLAGKFPDPLQSSEKIGMHPAAAREEQSVQQYSVGTQRTPGEVWRDPERSGALDTSMEEQQERRALFGHSERWDRFEELMRKNRVDITAKCPSCKPAKERVA